ncbi:MAG: PAS domain-containing protein [Rickettsiales bacterium]|jgi:hypothetical protein|nr:PAS domain-containing protein [Rickettsiales bacterium]
MMASSVNERRITVRLMAYWEKLRAGRDMPREQDVDPDAISDLWDYCFLLNVKDMGKEGYQYTYLGPEIKKAYQGGLAEGDTNGLVSPNADRMADCYMEIIHSKAPVVDEGEFRNIRGDMVKYRQCLLPLGEEGDVKAVFGGMRYKIYTA